MKEEALLSGVLAPALRTHVTDGQILFREAT
jgi:hypothetical protein